MRTLVGACQSVDVAGLVPGVGLAGLLGSGGVLRVVDGKVQMIDGVAGAVVAVMLDNLGCRGAIVVLRAVASPYHAVAGRDIVGYLDLVAYGKVQGVDAVAQAVYHVDGGVVICAGGAVCMSAPGDGTAVDDGLGSSETVVIHRQVQGVGRHAAVVVVVRTLVGACQSVDVACLVPCVGLAGLGTLNAVCRSVHRQAQVVETVAHAHDGPASSNLGSRVVQGQHDVVGPVVPTAAPLHAVACLCLSIAVDSVRYGEQQVVHAVCHTVRRSADGVAVVAAACKHAAVGVVHHPRIGAARSVYPDVGNAVAVHHEVERVGNVATVCVAVVVTVVACLAVGNTMPMEAVLRYLCRRLVVGTVDGQCEGVGRVAACYRAVSDMRRSNSGTGGMVHSWLALPAEAVARHRCLRCRHGVADGQIKRVEAVAQAVYRVGLCITVCAAGIIGRRVHCPCVAIAGMHSVSLRCAVAVDGDVERVCGVAPVAVNIVVSVVAADAVVHPVPLERVARLGNSRSMTCRMYPHVQVVVAVAHARYRVALYLVEFVDDAARAMTHRAVPVQAVARHAVLAGVCRMRYLEVKLVDAVRRAADGADHRVVVRAAGRVGVAVAAAVDIRADSGRPCVGLARCHVANNRHVVVRDGQVQCVGNVAPVGVEVVVTVVTADAVVSTVPQERVARRDCHTLVARCVDGKVQCVCCIAIS